MYMKLYCCNTDGCNSPDQANSLPFVETSCMQGMLSISAPAAHTLGKIINLEHTFVAFFFENIFLFYKNVINPTI